MRIGIVTFWQSQDNYGQLLQCWALQQFLKQLGHEPFLIRYSPRERNVSFIRKLWSVLKLALRPSEFHTYMKWKRLNAVSLQEAQKHDRHFGQFIQMHIKSTPIVGTEELKANPPKAEAYVCGSDQIWGGTDDIFYLQFGDSTVKRLAYAPSFGGLQPNKQLLLKIKEYLTDFTFVSSRERKGVELLQSLGYNEASLVPDPTILLSVSAYRDLESSCLAEDGKYLLLYLLGNEIPLEVNSIFDFAAKYGLKVKYVASQGRMDHYPKLYPTIEEWLELVDKASYVITNSFHGTVFSLTFNTPFLVIPVSGVVSRMNNRISDLLVGCNLKERIYQKSLDEIFLPIDFSCFNRNKGKNRTEIQNLFTQLLFEK